MQYNGCTCSRIEDCSIVVIMSVRSVGIEDVYISYLKLLCVDVLADNTHGNLCDILLTYINFITVDCGEPILYLQVALSSNSTFFLAGHMTRQISS